MLDQMKNKIIHLCNNKELAEKPIGENPGDKREEGDKRTPIGESKIIRITQLHDIPYNGNDVYGLKSRKGVPGNYVQLAKGKPGYIGTKAMELFLNDYAVKSDNGEIVAFVHDFPEETRLQHSAVNFQDNKMFNHRLVEDKKTGLIRKEYGFTNIDKFEKIPPRLRKEFYMLLE